MNRALASAICFGAFISFSCGGAESNQRASDSSSARVVDQLQLPPTPEALNASSSAQASPSMAVSAYAAEVSVQRGGMAEATVQVVVASGYHVNANPPSFPYLRPTELRVTPIDGISIGAPVYPAAENKKFSFAEQPIAVYEGTASIRLPVRASVGAPLGAHRLHATVQAQPCNDQACFPSRIIELTLPVIVR